MPDLTLVRSTISEKGAFGQLIMGPHQWFTCERTFQKPPSTDWTTKIPEGTFKCVRGVHRLAFSKPFVTFEVVGIKGHSGLLFHWGNTIKDSQGCVLLGNSRGTLYGLPAVMNSKEAFGHFMRLLESKEELELEVRNGLVKK